MRADWGIQFRPVCALLQHWPWGSQWRSTGWSARPASRIVRCWTF